MQFVIGGYESCFPDMPYFYFNNSQFDLVVNNNNTEYPISLPGNWCGFNYTDDTNYTYINSSIPVITNWSHPSEMIGGGNGTKYFYNSGFDKVSMMRHYILGGLLILLSIFDLKTFSYFPIEKRLFVRQEERSIEEQAIIRDSEGDFYRDDFK